jgi:hypothetical protein
LPLSGVHSILMEKLAHPNEGGGCMPTPFHYNYYHQQSCGLRSSWEGRYTTPISTLPLWVLCGIIAVHGHLCPTHMQWTCAHVCKRLTNLRALLWFCQWTILQQPCNNPTLIKKKIKFSSYVRKFRMEQLQSHIRLTASSSIREPFRIRLCNCSTLNFLIYEENLMFFFYQCIPHSWSWIPFLPVRSHFSTPCARLYCIIYYII